MPAKTEDPRARYAQPESLGRPTAARKDIAALSRALKDRYGVTLKKVSHADVGHDHFVWKGRINLHGKDWDITIYADYFTPAYLRCDLHEFDLSYLALIAGAH